MSDDIPVLVAGGSLVGLSAALFLSIQGVPCRVVERRATTGTHPRAKGFNPRTMELLRPAGVEAAVRRAEAEVIPDFARFGGLFKAESLAGRELSWIQQGTDFDRVNAAQWAVCGQHRMEPVLRERAEQLGADIRFGTELVALEQGSDAVTATVREVDTGRERRWRAGYVVAADGSRSPIREALGCRLVGPGLRSHNLVITFRADLERARRGRRFLICYVEQAGMRGVLMPHDRDGGWQLDIRYDPDRGERLADFTDARCVELVRRAAGEPDLPVTIVSRLAWEADARVAERLRWGRVLLAGDAAHVMPPTGGLGANTGMQDAHNLAWKLAAVLGGAAGGELLDTYDAERRPVAAFTVDQALARYVDRVGYLNEEVAPIVEDVTLWLGCRYAAGALVAEDDDPSPCEDPRTPSGRPGGRAPHVLLERDGALVSTHDLFGPSFALLTGPEDAGWERAAGRVGERLGLRLAVHGIDRDVRDLDRAWCAAYAVEPTGAVLVRPDGHIAWRSRTRVERPDLALASALSRVLSRTVTEV